MQRRGSGRRWAATALAVATLAATLTAVDVAPASAAGTGATSGTLTVSGSGYGHGVGLSQYGAYGQAKANPALTGAEIAAYYYAGTKVAAYTDSVPLKVDVVHGASSMGLATTAVGSGGGGLTMAVPGAPAVTVPSGGTVSLGLSSGNVLLVQRDASGVAVPGGTLRGASATITWASSPTTLDVSSPGKSRRYRWGSLQVAPRSGALQALLTVNLHSEYLKGIAEMPSSWPAAALQAQVIAARTYALHAYRSGLRSDCGCHVYDSVSSQVYSGWDKEAQATYGARWVDAVTATQTSATTGLTVLASGVPIDAVFFSSSGGRTRNNEDVWGGSALSYARSEPDPWSVNAAINPSYAHWTRSVSVATVLRLFGLPDLTAITVSKRDASGAAMTITATASNGVSTSISASKFRSTFGLPAAWITAFSGLPLSFPHPAGMSEVYWSPGQRTVNGRLWRTTCEKYSTGARCFTSIWATQYVRSGSGYVAKVGWVDNSINYFDHESSVWTNNVNVTPGTRVVNGRTWRTTCSPNASTGERTCRVEIWASLVSRRKLSTGRYQYYTYQGWDFIAFAHLQ